MLMTRMNEIETPAPGLPPLAHTLDQLTQQLDALQKLEEHACQIGNRLLGAAELKPMPAGSQAPTPAPEGLVEYAALLPIALGATIQRLQDDLARIERALV